MKPTPYEWPTYGVFVLAYGLWGIGTLTVVPVWVGIVMVALGCALYSSLCHEVLHGHPTRNQFFNECLVFPSLTLVVPYLRFKDTHLVHHRDVNLTDPYDDPESNFMEPSVWQRLNAPTKALFRVNNTLLGRIVLGPLISTVVCSVMDARMIARGNRRVLFGWALQVPAVGVVLVVYVQWGQLPVWAYLLGTYAGLSILKIRTYLEHRAHDNARGRTVLIEDRGLLSFLFLNNNFHIVHHMHPGVAWYDLPALFRAKREHFLTRNDAYYYRNYREIFARHLLRAKDPIAHPIWPVRKDVSDL